MTLNLDAEEANILARLETLCGGRVYDFIPDDLILERDPDTAIVKPYITVNFGEPYPSGDDRSVGGGEETQPHVWVVSVTFWGATTNHTRPGGRELRRLLIGWSPSDTGNTSDFEGRGGGSFQDRDASARPTKSARLVTVAAITNLAA